MNEIVEVAKLPVGEIMRVSQLPIIEEHLKTVKEAVEKRVSEAKSLACTPDTLTSVKAVRADLNKEFDKLEEQRKAVKSAVMKPYDDFESVYKSCVSNAYKSAIGELGQKIRDTEDGIKADCREQLESYFAELVALENLSWLTFDQLGIEISLTEAKQKTHKKLMDRIKEAVSDIAECVKALGRMEYSTEIMVEYKNTLNLPLSVSLVAERHKAMEREQVEAEARREAVEAQERAVERVDAIAPPVQVSAEQTEILRTTFTVTGTREQLKKLKNFLIMEGIKYE